MTADDDRAHEVLAALRTRTDEPLLLRGFGPLILGVVLVVLMTLLVPSVAPERIVERPAGAGAVSVTEGDG